MNISELAEAVAARHGLSKTDTSTIVDAVFAAIAQAAVRIRFWSIGPYNPGPSRAGVNPWPQPQRRGGPW